MTYCQNKILKNSKNPKDQNKQKNLPQPQTDKIIKCNTLEEAFGKFQKWKIIQDFLFFYQNYVAGKTQIISSFKTFCEDQDHHSLLNDDYDDTKLTSYNSWHS